MVIFAVVRLIDEQDRLLPPVAELLAAVSGVDLALVMEARVVSRRRNWLRFPWYAASRGGGAFVMGRSIYAHDHFLNGSKEALLPFLLLLSHEVGHLPHAARFHRKAWGSARFVFWAAGQYALSFLRHGRQAHRRARIEQEAERGRWVLQALFNEGGRSSLINALNDRDRMRSWLLERKAFIANAHAHYPGW